MFHTPPTKDSWPTETSIHNSYQLEDDNDSQGLDTTTTTQKLTETRTIDIHIPLPRTDESMEKPVIRHHALASQDTLTDATTSLGPSTSHGSSKRATSNEEQEQDESTLTSQTDRMENEAEYQHHDQSHPSDIAITQEESEDNDCNHDKDEEVDDIPELEESFQQVSEDDLPIELLKEYLDFIKYLKEPRFAKPLATFEIADLFQDFYKAFSKRMKDFFNDEKKVELSDLNKPKDSLSYEYNLLVERLLCDKFYSAIMFPTKSLPSDELIKQINIKFSQKLSILNTLNISLSHLDLDLQVDETKFNLMLHEEILPDFELFTAERSPTLKMKYLFKLHKLLGKLIKDCSSCGSDKLNTDVFLPIFIYSVIKLEDLTTHSLVNQLQFIKKFSNEYVYSSGFDGSYDREKGQLLYVLANFEACIAYLASVTLENLNVDFFPPDTPDEIRNTQQVPEILTVPIKIELIDQETSKGRKDKRGALKYPPTSSSTSASTFLDTYNKRVTFGDFTPSLYSADQGIRNISNTIDSSIRNIMGKVSWLGSSTNDQTSTSSNEDGLPESLRKQLEENLIIQETGKSDDSKVIEQKITPTSSISTNDSGNNNANSGHPTVHVKTHSTSSLNLHLQNQVIHELDGQNQPLSAHAQVQPALCSPTSQDKFLNKFTNSVGGVMKTFRPISASSSTTSLNTTLENGNNNNNNNNGEFLATTPSKTNSLNTINGNSNSYFQFPANSAADTKNKIRSRATSLMNTSLFGGSNTSAATPINGSGPVVREHRPSYSLLNSIENAFDNVRNRSRGSSMSDHPLLQSQQQSQQQAQQFQSQNGGLPSPGHGIPLSTPVSLLAAANNSVHSATSSKTADDSNDGWTDEASKFKKFDNKEFNDLSIAELKEVYQNYQFIMKNLQRQTQSGN